MNIFLSDGARVPPLKAALNIFITTAAVVALFWFVLLRLGLGFNFSFLIDLRVRLLDGFLMTVYLSISSLILSLVLGVSGAALQNSRVLALRYLAKGYVTFIRGTPLIVQIYLFHYIVGTAFGIGSRFVSGVLILSVFEGAYIAEIIRGSYLSLDGTQLEAAKSVGFTKRQVVSLVVLPQMVARTLPALAGQFASIIKDSSLLSMISVIELTQTIREITAGNFNWFASYFTLGVLYLILTLPITAISRRLERRFNYET